MTTDLDHQFMQLALDICQQGVARGQSPFGACIVREQQVLATTHNTVWLSKDATAHAEVNAIRQACQKLGHVHLQGATIYSTTEPCPMCFTAIHWARIKRIVYAARVEDASAFGFNELPISNRQLIEVGRSDMQLQGDFLRAQALDIFRQWASRQDHQAY